MEGPDCWKLFEHSMEYTSNGEFSDKHVRPPNHLNPIRRSIAIRYDFKEIDFGEDSDWSLRICGDKAIKTERQVEKPLYYYIPSGIRRRYRGVSAWNTETMDVIDADHNKGKIIRRPKKKAPPNPVEPEPLPEDPGQAIGEQVKPDESAPEHTPGLFPTALPGDPHRVGIGGWRFEGPEWMRQQKIRQMQKQR